MYKINENYQKLPGSYLFSTIARKVAAFTEASPDKEIIRLGIGDVTQPLAPAIIQAMHKAVDEMGDAAAFRGYAPDAGYDFLRNAIAEHDYRSRGCSISADEIFVSDGAKSDSANIQEIFGGENRIAVCDPVYPVYVDSNVMAGRTGVYDREKETWSNVIYMPCTMENGFVPEFPKERPDMIYLCLPNNPTGTTITRAQLQEWVDYAAKVGAVIIYDAAYEAYISEENVAHSIYECEGAEKCAIELKSFSKNAGFTGVRLGYTVVPKALKCGEVSLNQMWASWNQIQRGALHCPAGRRGSLQPAGKGSVKGAGGLLYEKCRGHQKWSAGCRLYRIRWCQRPLYLDENTWKHDVLGIF